MFFWARRHRDSLPNTIFYRGQAALEFAIVLPLVVFLLISTVDMGMMMNDYLKLTYISYEGARYAATLAGLAQQEGSEATETSERKINEVKTRVLDLLKKNGFSDDSISIDVRYIPLNPDSQEGLPEDIDPEDIGNTVTITTRVSFKGYFPLFDGLPISATATAPYLFKDEDVGG